MREIREVSVLGSLLVVSYFAIQTASDSCCMSSLEGTHRLAPRNRGVKISR